LNREISKTGMEKMMKEKGKRLAARETQRNVTVVYTSNFTKYLNLRNQL
jgi:hypothetical protein